MKVDFHRVILLTVAMTLFVPILSSAESMVVPLGEHFFVIPTDVGDPSTTDPPLLVPQIPVGFDYVRDNERILTGFPIGHNLPKARNQLFYNLELDGYGGLPFGSCLERGYLLEQSDPNKSLCTANENRDLLRVWDNRNPNLKNVLLKNLTIKNAFRTYNVVDGEVVTSSGKLPHVDSFQMYYAGSSMEDPDWLGIQDTIVKNSDNSLMITGGSKFKGAVYQNLHAVCDSEFAEDDRQRTVNDYAVYRSGEQVPTNYSCTNSITFASLVQSTVWLIDIQAGSTGESSIQILNEGGSVIAVGSNAANWKIRTREQRGSPVIPHPNVHYYTSIEAALENEARPPFIEYSCTGWANPPSGCESRLGYFGG